MSSDPATDKGAITLQYQMSKGDQSVYDITVDSTRESVTSGERSLERDLLKMRMAQRVTKVADDGSYCLEMLVEPYQLVKNGEEMTLNSVRQEVTLRMAKSGEIIETSLERSATLPFFPARALSLGDTWKGESRVNLTNPTTGQPLQHGLTFVYTLKDVQAVMGYQCAHIKVNNPENEIMLAPGITQRITARGDTFFAHLRGDGRLVKSDVETRIMITFPDGVLQNKIKVSVELVAHTAGTEPGEPESRANPAPESQKVLGPL